MKKSALINSHLSHLVSMLGHTDEVTFGDAGLPIPDSTQRIDLALTLGVPTFLETVKVWLSEAQIEGMVLAEEIKTKNPQLHQSLLALIEQSTTQPIHIEYVSHEQFKSRTAQSKAVVRTGECSPYANVIFQSGVVF